MKKFFTLLFVACAGLSLSAMTINVSAEGYEETPITADTEISFNETDFTGDVYDLNGMVALPEGATTLTVIIQRSDVEVEDQFCIGGSCMASNGEATQTLEFTQVKSPASWFAHCPVSEGINTIVYTFKAGSESLKLTVRYGDDSAVENVSRDNLRQGVFTIFGQQLRKDNSTEGLPAGMYIIGGKKQIIR